MAEVKYTEFAQQAVGLADIFNEAFKKPLAGKPANYRVQLAIPDGPSTAGGKQGTQHIKLVPMGRGPPSSPAGRTRRTRRPRSAVGSTCAPSRTSGPGPPGCPTSRPTGSWCWT